MLELDISNRRLFDMYGKLPIYSFIFDIVFYPGNNSVDFNVVAITTIDNKTVGVNVNLIAYGLNVLQRNISLCDIDYQGIGNTKNNPLCPLMSGHLI